jgi:hypothetical protein
MTLRKFVSIFTTAAVAAWILNIVWLATLAGPLAFLWNHAVLPVGDLPHIGYWRAYGVLLFWFLLSSANIAVKLSTKTDRLGL